MVGRHYKVGCLVSIKVFGKWIIWIGIWIIWIGIWIGVLPPYPCWGMQAFQYRCAQMHVYNSIIYGTAQM